MRLWRTKEEPAVVEAQFVEGHARSHKNNMCTDVVDTNAHVQGARPSLQRSWLQLRPMPKVWRPSWRWPANVRRHAWSTLPRTRRLSRSRPCRWVGATALQISGCKTAESRLDCLWCVTIAWEENCWEHCLWCATIAGGEHCWEQAGLSLVRHC